MSDAILDHGGTLVAYMGDGIMAVFGAPIEQDDHADRALAAAREMLDVRLPRFNEWLREQGLGEGFRMGIGLNSGRVMSGNVGSERRRRVHRDRRHDQHRVAARGHDEGHAPPAVRRRLHARAAQEPPPDLVYVDEFEVRGRQARVKLWSVPDKDEAVPHAVGRRRARPGPRPSSASFGRSRPRLSPQLAHRGDHRGPTAGRRGRGRREARRGE